MERLHKLLGDDLVVLASRSPRRLDILKNDMGLENVKVVPSQFPEDLEKDLYAPFEYVVQTAIRKALDVYQSEADADEPPELVLAADTVVVDNGIVLEKPHSVENHITMLKQLRDATHPQKVYTGVVAIVPFDKPITPGYAMESYLGESEVVFRKDITDEEIIEYVKSGEGTDAAGGYKVQGDGARFIESIKGDKTNVVGLPVAGTVGLIEKTYAVAKDDSDDEYEVEVLEE